MPGRVGRRAVIPVAALLATPTAATAGLQATSSGSQPVGSGSWAAVATTQ